ncbi:MAG: AlpA family phage regulatory protein [Gammaproteobacteria bacterium]|jgi:predicted DNA-binding transcriptional regulator AlpA|nr:AlpA family phage regulatory protein [Gammaproteobacteria bacterium]
MDRSIPQTGFLRLRQIVGDKTQGIPPIIPVSKSTWWAGVASGKFPKPVKLGPATTAWRAEDIQALIKEFAG